MPERQGRGGNGRSPYDRSSTSSFRLSELSGRQPVVPKPPPGRKRVDPPPSTPRVARPEREDPEEPKRRTWKWWTGCLGALLVVGLLLFIIIYGATNLLVGLGDAGPSAGKATDFLSSLKTGNYDQAYEDLGGNLTSGPNSITKADFIQKAQADDRCYGQITDYNDDNSATKGDNTYSYGYDITRSNLKSSYKLRLTLAKVGNDWVITDYGGDLGPAPPTCK
jgi:hypothetical protein